MKGLLIKDILIMRNQKSTSLLIVLMGVMMSIYMQSSTVIGYLMIIALPDRGSVSAGSFESRDLPQL